MLKQKTKKHEDGGYPVEVYVPRGWNPILHDQGKRFTTCCDCNALIHAEEGPRCGSCQRAKNKAKVARRQAKRSGLGMLAVSGGGAQ